MHVFAPICGPEDSRLPHNLMSRTAGLRVTWIPKNMCSTLKLSVAVVEGVIPRAQISAFRAHPAWIHEWIYPLEPRHFQACEAPTSVAVLREPAGRLKSAIVEKALFEEQSEFDRIVLPLLRWYAAYVKKDVADMSVADLLGGLAWFPDRVLDYHWRSQISFLSGAYDALLPMSDRSAVEGYFAERGIALHSVEHHATSNIEGEPLDIGPQDPIAALRQAFGGRMRPARFSPELEALVEQTVTQRFTDDLALWRSLPYPTVG
jgi:hypothetical protein